MAYDKWKSEAGQGGKLGHSNMAHWDYTEAIKESSRALRRLESRKMINGINIKSGGCNYHLILKTGFARIDYEVFLDRLISSLLKKQVLITGRIEGNEIEGEIDLASTNLDEQETLSVLDKYLEEQVHIVQEMKIKNSA